MTLIDPSGIPGADLDLHAVRTGATGITKNGGVIRDQGADIVRDWQHLPASFEATGTELLYSAMAPVGTTTATIGDSLSAVAKALAAYADEVEPIKARLDSLRTQATSFAAKANSFQSKTEWVSSAYTLGIPHPQKIDSWDQDPGMNDTNNSLIRQVADAEADWLDAQQRCATAIRAAVGLGAKGASDEQALAKQLRSGDEQGTPWGSTSDRKESCSEKATTFPAHFLWDGVIVGFGWGTIKSLDTLMGMNPDAVWKAESGILHGDWGQVVEAGKEDLAATGQAWLGLTHLVSSVAIPIDPATRMALLHSPAFDWLPADVRKGAEDWTAADGTALYGTLAGFVGLTLPTKWWDPKAYKADQVFKNWTENPGGAAGTSVANIGSFFIPGAGEARAGGVAADAAKVAEGTRVADMLADGSIGSLRGLSADALKATIKGLSDADAAKLATELAKPELDAGALSSLKLDDLTIHEPVHVGGEGADAHGGGAHQPGAPDESAASRTDGTDGPARSPEPPAERSGESEGGAGAAAADDPARRATGSSTPAHDLDEAARQPALVGAERQTAGTERAAADDPTAPDPVAPLSADGAVHDGAPEVRNEAGSHSDPIETTRTTDPTPQSGGSSDHAQGDTGGHGAAGEHPASGGERPDAVVAHGDDAGAPAHDGSTAGPESATHEAASSVPPAAFNGSDVEHALRSALAQGLHDSAGRDISGTVGASRLTEPELARYLEASYPEEAKAFADTGVWPEDVQIPKGPEVLDADGRIDWSQAPRGGYALDASGEPISQVVHPQVGDRIDRFGPPFGRYTSPFVDGHPFTYPQRGLPYVEQASQYHVYEWARPIEDAPEAIAKLDDPVLRQEIEDYVDRFDVRFEVREGPIARAFDEPGGGVQDQLPMPPAYLVAIGVLKEIR